MENVITHLMNNQASLWFTLGFLLLAIEILAFGFGSGVLLFGSLGALITGALLWFGVIPSEWIFSVASFALAAVASTAILWKPLQSMQSGAKLGNDRSSDLIGHKFRLSSDVTRTVESKHRYSGIEWRVKISEDSNDDTIAEGSRVRVAKVDAGIFHVVPD